MSEHVSKLHQRILEGANIAVAEAIEKHRRLGEFIVVMRDGKITWLSSEEIAPLEQCNQSAIRNPQSSIE